MARLKIVNTSPSHESWREYLLLTFSYLRENWYQEFGQMDEQSFFRDCTKELEGRIRQGGRGLFLLGDESGWIGVSNTYITDDSERTLNVAEYYVSPRKRRKGIGKSFFRMVENWGRRQGCRRIQVEVDHDLEIANKFWGSFLKLDNALEKDGRLLYKGDIDNVKVFWIRHAKIVPHPDRSRLPHDNELNIDRDWTVEGIRLRHEFMTKLEGQVIYHSPLTRARQTVEMISSWLGGKCDLQQKDGLKEHFPESIKGMSIDELHDKYGGDLERRMVETPTSVKFEGCESFEEAYERIVATISDILFDLSNTTTKRFLVSHQLLHNIFVIGLLGGNYDMLYSLRLGNLNHSCYTFDHSKKIFRIGCLNKGG